MVEEEINIPEHLTLLRRSVDGNIRNILGYVKFVVLYEFDPAPQRWHKMKNEGALYVVDRYTEPVYQFLILNRRAVEDFKYELKATVKVQRQEQIWSFKDEDNGTTYGIWSSFSNQMDQTFEKIKELVNSPMSVQDVLANRLGQVAPGFGLGTPLIAPTADQPILKSGFSKVKLNLDESKTHRARALILKLANDEDFLEYASKYLP